MKFFHETGVNGMLEAADNDTIEMVPGFTGEIDGRATGEIEVSVVNLFVKYVGMVYFYSRKNMETGWKKSYFANLTQKIVRLH